jgi:hypothetical protein
MPALSVLLPLPITSDEYSQSQNNHRVSQMKTSLHEASSPPYVAGNPTHT